jgi:hypothetical protein
VNCHISKRKSLKNTRIFITFCRKKESVQGKKMKKKENKNGDDLIYVFDE